MIRRCSFLLALLPLLVPPFASASPCVQADVELSPGELRGAVLYRIDFRNACEAPRSLYWCVEHPAAAVPPEIACPAARYAMPAEPVYLIQRRKTFQWLLPRGSRVRLHDCAATDRPTLDQGCASAY